MILLLTDTKIHIIFKSLWGSLQILAPECIPFVSNPGDAERRAKAGPQALSCRKRVEGQFKKQHRDKLPIYGIQILYKLAGFSSKLSKSHFWSLKTTAYIYFLRHYKRTACINHSKGKKKYFTEAQNMRNKEIKIHKYVFNHPKSYLKIQQV